MPCLLVWETARLLCLKVCPPLKHAYSSIYNVRVCIHVCVRLHVCVGVRGLHVWCVWPLLNSEKKGMKFIL